MKKINLLIGLMMSVLISIPITMHAQTTCPNLNFSYGDFTYWEAYAGSCGSGVSMNQKGVKDGRHTIMDAQQLMLAGQMQDERCMVIPKVPNGFSYAARLGNDNTGAEMEALEYTMTVDTTNAFLILHFAWVLENPDHEPAMQPKFTMTIKDSMGRKINDRLLPCSNVEFTASQELANIICQTPDFIARNWTTIGFSLERLIGQRIKIYFETRDCTQGEHFGYAYIVGECRPMTIDLLYCGESSAARMRAPDGFARYKWTRSSNPAWKIEGDGRNFQNIIVPDSIDGEEFICVVTSELGESCSATLRTIVAKTSIDADFVYGAIDSGQIFPPTTFENFYDTCNRTATFVDMSTVRNSKKASILWEIPGLNVVSYDSLFTYTFPDPDEPVEYVVRLTVYAENGCIDTSRGRANHRIMIYPSSKVDIAGATQLCAGDTTYLKAIAVRHNFIEHTWTWMDSNQVMQTAKGDSLAIYGPGTYYLSSKDNDRCFAQDTHIVTPLKPVMSVNITDVACYGGATGQIMHGSVTGGQPPYQPFNWILLDTNGNSYTESGDVNGATYTNLIAGTYIFEAIDARGCLLYDEIVIKQNDSLKITATQTPATCEWHNGSLELTATGGIPPYQFEIRKADNTLVASSNIVSNLNAGVYRISVIDAAGCITSDNITITSMPPHIELYVNTRGTPWSEIGVVNIIQASTCTNDTAIIKAMPYIGYRFVQWNDGDTNNPRTITTTQDTVFIALFEAATIDITVTGLETSALNVYPNPTRDYIHIVLPDNVVHAVFTLYDMQGKELIRKEIGRRDEVPVSNLATGIYIYNVTTNKQKHTGKLIINK
ncbi:MAG: T9SS type A sorting domain-containing protein [Bacteroidales bacterium]|jgi:hypothetical protein|nr:T9SS type A sorting domain-containing protein [Bacteroidales bacterium]